MTRFSLTLLTAVALVAMFAAPSYAQFRRPAVVVQTPGANVAVGRAGFFRGNGFRARAFAFNHGFHARNAFAAPSYGYSGTVGLGGHGGTVSLAAAADPCFGFNATARSFSYGLTAPKTEVVEEVNQVPVTRTRTTTTETVTEEGTQSLRTFRRTVK